MLGFKKLTLEGSISPSAGKIYFPVEVLKSTHLLHNQYYEIRVRKPNIILLTPVEEKDYGVYRLIIGYRQGNPYFASFDSRKLTRKLLTTFEWLSKTEKTYFKISTKDKTIRLKLEG